MSSILNVSSSQTTQPRPVQTQSTASAAQPTLTQLLEEPAYELHLQALEGNTQAAELYAQQQASSTYQGAPAAGPGTLTGGLAVDFLA